MASTLPLASSLWSLILLGLFFVPSPGAAQSGLDSNLATEIEDREIWLTVHFERGWATDTDGDPLMKSVVEVACPTGHAARDLEGWWIPYPPRSILEPKSVLSELTASIDEVVQATSEKPVTINGDKILAARCTRQAARQGGLGDRPQDRIRQPTLSPFPGDRAAGLRDLLVLEGHCDPRPWGPAETRDGGDVESTVVLECVQGTLKDIHEPSSTSDPPPPDGKSPWEPIPDSSRVSGDSLSLKFVDLSSDGPTSPETGLDATVPSPKTGVVLPRGPRWRLFLPLGQGVLRVPVVHASRTISLAQSGPNPDSATATGADDGGGSGGNPGVTRLAGTEER